VWIHHKIEKKEKKKKHLPTSPGMLKLALKASQAAFVPEDTLYAQLTV